MTEDNDSIHLSIYNSSVERSLRAASNWIWITGGGIEATGDFILSSLFIARVIQYVNMEPAIEILAKA